MAASERTIDYVIPVNHRRVRLVRRTGVALAITSGLALLGGASAVESESAKPQNKVNIETIKTANKVVLGGILAEGAAASILILTHNRRPKIIYKQQPLLIGR